MSGAVPGRVFLGMMLHAGFGEAEIVGETGFNTSPVTRGVTIRAVKPLAARIGETDAQYFFPKEGELRLMHADACGLQRDVGRT